MSIQKTATRPAPPVAPKPGAPKPGPRPAPAETASAAPQEPEEMLLKRRMFGLLPPKTDRTPAGFVRAIRRAVDDLSEINWTSPADMCDGIEEHIRKALNARAGDIEVRWVGTRRSNQATRLVVISSWGHREDFEHALSFALFAPGARA